MGIELGIGETLLIKAIAESTGRSNAKIKEDLRKEGDLGKVAMVSRASPIMCLATAQAEHIGFPQHAAHNVQAQTLDCAFGLSKSNGYRKSER